jgi:tetratricopeptide (TPR) repeat protein
MRLLWATGLALAGIVLSPELAPAAQAPSETDLDLAALAAAAEQAVPLGAPEAASGVEQSGSSGVSAASPAADRIGEAWAAPGESLETRVTRTRRAALEVGVWNLDAAARAVIAGGSGGDPLERARAAVILAPDLPSARMALARALWLDGNAPMAALRSVGDALAVAVRHPEASVWFAGTGLFVLTISLLIAALVTIGIAAASAALHAAHDLGHAVAASAPEYARAAVLGALILAPLMLGEGVMGLALALLAVGLVYGSARQRCALTLAAAAMIAALFPLARTTGAVLELFPRDPVAASAYAMGAGSGTSLDVARLEAATSRDPLASQGLAIRDRQMGRLGRADARYQRLLEASSGDPAVANNAANVRLDLGHMESAIDLYDRALEAGPSATVLFNLSQAHGRGFQVDDLNRTLAMAQAVDGELIAELTSLQRSKAQGFIVDLPLDGRRVWDRLRAGDGGEAFAAGFRARVAPGRTGRTLRHAAASVVLVVLVFSLLGMRFEPAHGCGRCGERMCARCDADNQGEPLCRACRRLFFQPEKTERGKRLKRIEALRERQERGNRLAAGAAILVPGAAGALSARPFATLFGAFCFALAGACVVWRDGLVPDPLVAGSAATVAFFGVASIAALGHALVVLTSLSARARSQT